MDISLHPDLERFIREQVSTEGYRSPGEVVTEALFLLWQRDHGPVGPEATCSNADAQC
jgi:Arc/MetJ-type ribon-helix-helix transcriptional regulator